MQRFFCFQPVSSVFPSKKKKSRTLYLRQDPSCDEGLSYSGTSLPSNIWDCFLLSVGMLEVCCPSLARDMRCINTLIPSRVANPLAPTQIISPVLPLRRHQGLMQLLDGGAEHTGMLVGTQATSVGHNSPLSPHCPLHLVTSRQRFEGNSSADVYEKSPPQKCEKEGMKWVGNPPSKDFRRRR